MAADGQCWHDRAMTVLKSGMVFHLFLTMVIAAGPANLCKDGTNGTLYNCTESAGSRDDDSLSLVTVMATGIGATSLVEDLTTTGLDETSTAENDVLRFTLIGLVIALGILGVVVLLIIRRRTTKKLKDRKRSLETQEDDYVTTKLHPYYAIVNNLKKGAVYHVKSSSISDRGQYGDQV